MYINGKKLNVAIFRLQGESLHFDDFDGGFGGDWDAPALDSPAASPSRHSVASLSRRSDVTSSSSQRRGSGETMEDFDARLQAKRAEDLTAALRLRLVPGSDEVKFSALVDKVRRKEAAQKFYSLLVLQKSREVSVRQEGDNGDIFIARGHRFAAAAAV
jgi:chromatin segregation and condensation protein Rec8/ScpA/Scc1 (kleisin family)